MYVDGNQGNKDTAFQPLMAFIKWQQLTQSGKLFINAYIHMWLFMHKPAIHRKMQFFSMGESSVEGAICWFCVYVIDGIYTVLRTF